MTRWRVVLDAEMCTGSGMCLGVAPAAFAAGDDQRPVVRPATALAADDPLLPAVRDAVDCCPMEALRLEALRLEALRPDAEG